MRIIIITTPIRPRPTPFPPFGSLTLIKYLRGHGFDDIEFYNIDGNRPDYDAALEHIKARKPDILGISAVVSTAYEYSKRISLDVKEALPECLVVLGGNMGASANVLLKKTGIDLCVLGEGERIFLNIAKRAEQTHDPLKFADIAGIAMLDEQGEMINTDYEQQLPAENLYDIDWDDLEQSSDINIYFPAAHDENTAAGHLDQDDRFRQPHRIGKRIATLYTSKGCVSRCTFCHRWDKGIRFIPVETVMRRLDEVIERFDVGFLHTADENFGTNRRWLKEFCAEIAKRDVLWRVGTRATGMTTDVVEMMRDAGCTSIVFGNETGSERMLQIMEKKVKIEDNYNAVKSTIESGLGTTVQLVLGMPGETPETVAETTEFCKYTNSILPTQSANDLGINYAQALPGTPLYEFARSRGMIGEGLDGEEEYLIKISDRDAHDEYTTLNFTDFPKLICETWRPFITVSVNRHYVEKYGLAHYHQMLLRDTELFRQGRIDTGYFANPKRLVDTSSVDRAQVANARQVPGLWYLVRTRKWGLALICHPNLAYRMRRFLIILVIAKNLHSDGVGVVWRQVKEYLGYRLKVFGKVGKFAHEYKSLRRIVERDIGAIPGDDLAMAPLRKGR